MGCERRHGAVASMVKKCGMPRTGDKYCFGRDMSRDFRTGQKELPPKAAARFL
jgi:hypothetical protein